MSLTSKWDEERRNELAAGEKNVNYQPPWSKTAGRLMMPSFDLNRMELGGTATINKKRIVQGVGPIEYEIALRV
jgi:hypothetical protein